jgi:hypothetical protein
MEITRHEDVMSGGGACKMTRNFPTDIGEEGRSMDEVISFPGGHL